MPTHAVNNHRIGEARNPGPLTLGSFNPGQLLGSEDVVCNWGPGIWGASETSHTKTACGLIRSRFKAKGFNVQWSKPVDAHSHHADSLRGKATAVAVVSNFNLMPYPGSSPSSIIDASRSIETLAQLTSSVSMFVSSIYGPTHGVTFYDPWAVLGDICRHVFPRALAFRGPAAIVGDFNAELDQCPFWPALRQRGWVDAAQHDAARRGCQPKPTSKNNSRKTFILVNPVLLQALTWCDTREDYDFDTHPLLAAEFNIDSICRDRVVWSLPMTTDELFFNPQDMEEVCKATVEIREHKYLKALRENNLGEAMRQVNVAFEEVLAGSCDSETGAPAIFPSVCVGRGRVPLWKRIRASAILNKQPRADHFHAQVCQPSTYLRQTARQVRRLQSLTSQLQAIANGRGDSESVENHPLCSGISAVIPILCLSHFAVFRSR